MRGITEERLSQEFLKTLINYDEYSGNVTWKISRGKAAAGTLASDISTGSTGKKYRRITINNKKYKLHRIIWFYVHGIWPLNTIDHINGDGLDNRLCNLRDVDIRTNSLNRKLQNNNKTGIHGVTWHTNKNKWQVQIYSEEGYKHLGTYDNLLDAACARKYQEIILGYHSNHGR